MAGGFGARFERMQCLRRMLPLHEPGRVERGFYFWRAFLSHGALLAHACCEDHRERSRGKPRRPGVDLLAKLRRRRNGG